MNSPPTGQKTLFASGLAQPSALAFDTAGNLFVTEQGNGDVAEISYNGVVSPFASGFGNATALAISGIALPVPEPSSLPLAAAGALTLIFRLRKR